MTDKLKLECAVWWGAVVCTNCCIRFTSPSQIEWDHRHPVALGGSHDKDNIVPVCHPCHKLKTFGTKATSCGSDIHAIAKAKRLAAGGKRSKRPFRTDITRGFDGKVRKR